jgi:hypothetical protein
MRALLKAVQAKFSFFNPQFLQKIDRYLLVNYPRLWASRIHSVLFYGLISNVLVGLFVSIAFVPKITGNYYSYYGNYLSSSTLYYNLPGWVWFIVVPEIFLFIYWIYTQSWFNIEVNYGKTSSPTGIGEIFIYLACSFIFFSSSLTALTFGIIKTARYLEINRKTICGGPIITRLRNDFAKSQLYPLDPHRDMMLEMAEDAVKTGKAQEGGICTSSEPLGHKGQLAKVMISGLK